MLYNIEKTFANVKNYIVLCSRILFINLKITIMKKVIRRNLPVNDSYNFIESYNTGGMDNAELCSNCDKPIVNVAVISNSENKKFHVGLDCAKTLTNLHGLYSAEMDFSEMKSIISKVNKHSKKGELIFKIDSFGDLVCKQDNFYIFSKDISFAKRYLKQYLNHVINPEKIGFVYQKIDIELGFDRFVPKDNIAFKYHLKVCGFDCIISVQPFRHMVTNQITGYDFHLDIPELNYSHRETMYNNIKSSIEYQINKYYFDKFHN